MVYLMYIYMKGEMNSMFNDRGDLMNVFFIVIIALVIILALGALIGLVVSKYQKRKRNSASMKVEDSDNFLRQVRADIHQERGGRIDGWEE